MIYILTSQNELRFAKIWAGHLQIVCEALDLNETEYTQVDVLIAKSQTFCSNDVIINIGNHQYLGSELLNKLAESISVVGRTVFFMDDYQAPPATQLRKAITKSSNLLLTNIINLENLNLRKSLDCFEKVYVNLNKASFKLLPLKPVANSFIYWGSFRKGRLDLYNRYFQPTIYKTYVSSSERSHKKYADEWLNYSPLEKLNIPEDLQKFGFTIYMHDKKAPIQSPANRFYEAIGAGLPILFDIHNLPQLSKIPAKFIVENAVRISSLALGSIQNAQRELWGQQDYHQELVTELAKIFYNYRIL